MGQIIRNHNNWPRTRYNQIRRGFAAIARSPYPRIMSTLEDFVLMCPVCGQPVEGIVTSIVKDAVTARSDRRKKISEVGGQARIVPVEFRLDHACLMNTEELDVPEDEDEDEFA